MIWIDGVLVSSGESGVYGERILGGSRVWDPYRSKLSALCYKETVLDLTPEMRVLYLGAAHGTTVSHVADYTGVVYAVEVAPRPMQDLLEVARRRVNIVPIMADAAQPGSYAPLLEQVDLVYQDIAQPNQVAIALRNCIFLKPEGTLILMLKTRSVDVRRDPAEVLSGAESALAAAGLEIVSRFWLEPYHHDHAAIVCKNKRKGRDGHEPDLQV